MSRWSQRIVCAVISTLPLVVGACSEGRSMRPGGPLSTSLLLGKEASASLATQISRSEWPATSGRVETPEQTIFVEYYRDFTGNAANERNNPYRNFHSYRVGTSQK